MKKILLTLLFLAGFATSNAQSDDPVKSIIYNYLDDTCGYEPTYDQDGDIRFTMDGLIYYAIIKTTDDVSFVEFRISFESEKSLTELLTIANDYNRSKYLCKCSAKPGSFQISMEFAVSTNVQALVQTQLALHWFPVWIEQISEKI